MTDGITRRLQIGIAQFLDSVGVATYKTGSTTYSATDTAIAFDVVPPAPDKCITISIYNIESRSWDDVDVFSVQFRYRGTPAFVNNTADTVFDLLHYIGPTQLGGVQINDASRVSTAVLGQDQNKCQERVCNYELIITNPTTHRP